MFNLKLLFGTLGIFLALSLSGCSGDDGGSKQIDASQPDASQAVDAAPTADAAAADAAAVDAASSVDGN